MNKQIDSKGQSSLLDKILHTHFMDDAHLNVGVADNDQSLRHEIAQLFRLGQIAIDWKKPNLVQIPIDVQKMVGTVPNILIAELRFHLHVIQRLSASLYLDHHLNVALCRINNILLAIALEDDMFWKEQRSVKALIGYLFDRMMGWTDQLANTSLSLSTLFNHSIDKLALVDAKDDEKVDELLNEAMNDYYQIFVKFERLAERQKQTEIGHVKAEHCFDVIGLFLNQSLKDKKLPVFIASFLQNQWLHEMQIYLIKHGDSSPMWLRWRKMVLTLIKFYQQDLSVSQDASYKNILLNFAGEIDSLIKETELSTQLFEDFCAEIAFDFTQKANGIDLQTLTDVVPITLIRASADVEKTVSAELLNSAKAYDVGHWFVYQNEHQQTHRVRLLFKMPELDYLLFVNLLGQKILTLHFEQFAYLLSSQRLQPINQLECFDISYMNALEHLSKNIDELFAAKSKAVRHQQSNLEADIAKLDRRKAAEKAVEEAERLHKINQQREEEEERNILENMPDDAKRQAKLSLNSLALGSWVDMQDRKTHQQIRVKLAVKYSATGRFIFVDIDGNVMADCHRDELVDWILLNKFSLLENEGHYNERLEKIIKGIRKV